MPLKLLDYGRPNPFGEIIGKPRNLAWPVNAYRVTLPEVSEDGDGLNPFERVLLKMIDAGCAREAEALARETGIPFDLVQCVLLRLRDKALIDEHNEIIKQMRDNWKNNEDASPIFVTALLFRELVTGKIMPFLHRLDNHNPMKRKEGEEKRFRKVRYNDCHRDRLPTPRDVIFALRATKKRSIASGDDSRLPVVQQITIAHDPERYDLDCPIAIQKSDGEFRIADPFCNGFSLVFENAFSRLLEQDNKLSDWLMNWKQSLSNPRPDTQDMALTESYDTDANQGRFPNLISNLRLRRNTQHRSIEQIHAALEWALFYVCAQRPYDTAVNQLRLTNQSEHPDLLKSAAERVGLNLPQYGFRPVLGGKLDDFLSGKAEMGTVLSIALMMTEKDSSHPLHRIAAQHQDLINRLFDIKGKRDAQAHGKGKAQKAEIELPEEAVMREIVTALLPAIRFLETSIAVVDKEGVADTLLDARSSIQCEFGFKLFNRLGSDLQDRLTHVECFWLSCKDDDNALAFVCDNSAALQAMFRMKLASALPPDIGESEVKRAAQEKAIDAGLGALPKSLRTVKLDAIKRTMQGDDQSLGACVIAFLLVSTSDTLLSIADAQPTFMADVAEIVTLRGHGNETLPLAKKAIGKLRKQAFSTIKTLLEV
jgi:hypothetical protein